MKTLYLFFSLFSFTLSSYSQDSLSFYMEVASKNNPTVRQRFTEYKAALQKVPQVGGLPDPELSAGIFLSPMELVGGNQVADIRLMQMFPWFGVLKAAKDEMSLMANAKYESFRDAKLQVLFDLQQAWYELYKVQETIRITEENLEILHTLERLLLVRFRAASSGGSSSPGGTRTMSSPNGVPVNSGGSGMKAMGGSVQTSDGNGAGQSPVSMEGSPGGSGLADLYRIQMETGELQNALSLTKSVRSTVIARFNALLNRPVQSPIALPDSVRPNLLNVNVSAVSDSILLNNPMLAMLKIEEKSFDARKQMVTRMGYPMVGLGVNYSLVNRNPMSASAMNGKDMIMPMVTLSIPIYRKKYKAMQAEADLLRTAAGEGIQATSNALQADYYEAIQKYQDAQRRIELYGNQSRLANQSLNILIKSFSSSETGLADLLRIRQQTLDYRLKQVEAVADFNLSIARLKRIGNF